ncbi:acyltransferase domain-containing protein [Micromonospora sp. NPDC050980]|uniref:acyltransferase domain-containing protein n=1 Tax=Micromonospora sp. NPDC050980 TaxID=3155161 RepID=UPI0033F268E6
MASETTMVAGPAADPPPVRPRPVALLFAGQGAQRVRMAAGLYGADPVFTDTMDEILGCFGADGPSLRADWLAERPGVPIDAVSRAQPLLFAVNLALGRMVLGWGCRPAVLLGHSVGEIAAATLAGVFRLPDAVRLLRHRVAASAAAPPGGMLAVAAGVAQVAPFLGSQVVVGAVNSPRQTVLAGLDGPLTEVAHRLRAAGFVCQRVGCAVAFHSPAAAHLAADSLPLIRRLPLRPPRLPLYSAYTGSRVDGALAARPEFWAGHAVEPVLFWPTLDARLAEQDLLLVDASPGQALAVAARRHPAVVAGRSDVLALLPARSGPAEADRRSVDAAAARLRAEGHDVTARPLAGPGATPPGAAGSPIIVEPRWPRTGNHRRR